MATFALLHFFIGAARDNSYFPQSHLDDYGKNPDLFLEITRD